MPIHDSGEGTDAVRNVTAGGVADERQNAPVSPEGISGNHLIFNHKVY
jgi:hypothetical protein